MITVDDPARYPFVAAGQRSFHLDGTGRYAEFEPAVLDLRPGRSGREGALDIAFADDRGTAFALADCLAVVASGSNASPRHLARKLAAIGADPGDAIVTVAATVHDFAAVYSAHVSAYGSVPATLARIPGAVSRLWVNLIPADLVERFHATERLGVNYRFAALRAPGTSKTARVEIGGGRRLAAVHAYLSCHGHLTLGGDAPIPLAEWPQQFPEASAGLRDRARHQPAILAAIHALHVTDAPASALPEAEFRARLAGDADFRAAMTRRMKETALPPEPAGHDDGPRPVSAS